MPIRQTKRGEERTPLDIDAAVIVCGASFAGLAVARELAASGADVLLVDRYEIGERQTSACAIPTGWLEALALTAAIRQSFSELTFVRARGGSGPRYRRSWRLPWRFSTFDYPLLCALLAAQGKFTFETAKVNAITRGEVHTVHTDRGDLRAPLVVDALGWRRVLAGTESEPIRPPDGYLSRGLEVHPAGGSDAFEVWLDPQYIGPGYSWVFPAKDELRVGVGSFDPTLKVRAPTEQVAARCRLPREGFQGNWIPHRLREAVDDGVLFVGDSAGHCLPATAEGIRPALYFGLAAGRQLRAVLAGQQTRAQALANYRAFHDRHRHAYERLLQIQRLIGPANRSWLMDGAIIAFSPQPVIDRYFRRYLEIAPERFATSNRF